MTVFEKIEAQQGLSLEQARYEIGDIDSLCSQVCGCCTANDWYCPTECAVIEKARKMDFDRIVKSYARNWGDLKKVIRYIKQAKVG